MDNDKVRSITLRVAIFFGLTTFTLCIGIFYIESILDDTKTQLIQKDSAIVIMEKDVISQQQKLEAYEVEIRELKSMIPPAEPEAVQVEVAE